MREFKFRIPPDNKTATVNIEDTMKVKSFIEQLKKLNRLDVNKSYSITTLIGVELNEEGTFKGYDTNEFIVSEKVAANFQSNNQQFATDWGLGTITTPQSFHQLGIFVIDGSGSMTGTTTGNLSRADAVNIAVRETLTRFKASRKENCFSFSVVAFGDKARTVTPQQKCIDIDDYANYDPLQFFNNGKGSSSTNIASGLEEALSVAQTFFANKSSNTPHKVAIVVLTDGMCHNSENTKIIAETIKLNPNIQIYCCCLESLSGSYADAETLLKTIATNPALGYKTVYDKDTIRNFFVASITTASGLANIE